MNKTKIPFCDYTWNPVTGCTKISEGCQNCYAERQARRIWHMTAKNGNKWEYPEDAFKITYHPDRLLQPLKVKKPSIIFVCSMGDIFHPEVTDEWLNQIFATIAVARQHTFLCLTKRPERITWPISNLWIGVTAENQARANERIPKLIESWPGHKWLCMEPLLGNINWSCEVKWLDALNWIVCGNETGAGARLCKPEWVDYAYRQCGGAQKIKGRKYPFFWKGSIVVRGEVNRQEWPEEMER